MTDPKHVLHARQLQFGYRPDQPVLSGVHFTAFPGRFVCILGPNGSGKTTLLRCLLGWLQPAQGTILLDVRPLKKYSRKALAKLMAYVPQFPASAFPFSVQELVLMGRFAHTGSLGLTGQQDLAIAREAMKMTQTLDFAARRLNELSGGEAQCVMIARALAQQPSVMMLDEPTSHLDIRNQLKIYRMMQRLAHDWGMAVVCVSHELNLAGRFADELVFMRSGRVIAAGPRQQVLTRENLRQTYDVGIELLPNPFDPTPIIWAD